MGEADWCIGIEHKANTPLCTIYHSTKLSLISVRASKCPLAPQQGRERVIQDLCASYGPLWISISHFYSQLVYSYQFIATNVAANSKMLGPSWIMSCRGQCRNVSENLPMHLDVTSFLLLELLNFWFPWSSASLPRCKQLLTHRIYNPCQHFQEWYDIFAFLFACSYLKDGTK